MQYPKPVMRLSELKKMGFDENWLLTVFRTQTKRKVAWKTGLKSNCPILFDTEELEKIRRSQCVGR